MPETAVFSDCDIARQGVRVSAIASWKIVSFPLAFGQLSSRLGITPAFTQVEQPWILGRREVFGVA
jgi:hypothetical protein